MPKEPDFERTPVRRGRAAATNPPNRFERFHVEEDPSALEEEELRQVPTEWFVDHTRSILARNDSPDVGFTYSINPYRGCEHGCIYCYARPSHEYLGFSAGLDFETKILVKENAPELLEEAFQKKSWKPQVVALSGNTDCYQPAERKLGLTRRCLEVFLRHGNPVSIITKNGLVTRDLDLLKELASQQLVHVYLSITSLSDDLAARMEPRTARPALRLRTVEELAANGIPVGVMVAPMIPGLTDSEMPAILAAAAERGAGTASYVLLRLPGPVRDLFIDWLEHTFPDRVGRVLRRLEEIRGPALTDGRFGKRMRGEGEWADTFSRLFHVTCRRHGLDGKLPSLSTSHYRRLRPGQGELF